MTTQSGRMRRVLLGTAASSLALALAGPAAAQDKTPAIAVNDGVPPASVVDTTDITGVGQVVTDAGGGSVGLCTATLINPRTVIFAAHCVNEEAAGDYGPGGTPIGIGFKADTLDSIINWLRGGHQTSVTDYFYNINSIAFNPASLALGPDNNFLQGDVAIGSLDTPAANVPAWTLLFSALPTPAAIDPTTGTGYHVTITGYGRNGTGTTGTANGVDFRRRTAENVLGVLGSLDDVDSFLFGAPSGLPQNLYMIDFDDPNRGTPDANPFDFNVFKDKATPREGGTGPGDSGGPLIIDQAFGTDVKTVIGVLSGGSRYFNAQPDGAYGTSDFYQPLFLFWDYIAANNPYHYVTAKAGDGKWTDPTHWLTTLDPAYQVIGADGGLVNGIPDQPGAGVDGTSPKFGQICFQQPGINECVDLATGGSVIDDQPVPIGDEQPEGAGVQTSGHDRVTIESILGSRAESAAAPAGTQRPTADVAPRALPVATFANGLPGASGFVPQNSDGDRGAGVRPRYFDVTLSAAGTTTLDTDVEIDRLMIAGAQSALNITQDGALTTLIDATQFGGRLNVDGFFGTAGDYALIAGLLSGRGTVVTPFLTNVMGVIAPGDVGTVGTLTVAGNLVLSSGSTLAIDLGGTGGSDLLNVRAIPGLDGSGTADLGGNVVFTPVAGYRPRFADTATFLRAEGGITNRFGAGNQLSAILFPELTYTANSVSVRIAARPYRDVVDRTSAVQTAYAQLLDQNRVNYGALAGTFGQLDFLQLGPLQANLERLAPFTETTRTAIGRMPTESLARLYRDRIQLSRTGEVGGTLTMIGQPIRLAAQANAGLPAQDRAVSDVGPDYATRSAVRLPDTVSAFVAGGYLNGDSRAMPTSLGVGRDRLDGWFAAVGGEVSPQTGTTVGASLAYSSVKGKAAFGQRADGDLYQGALYGAYTTPAGIMLSGQASAGLFETNTRRDVPLGSAVSNLRQDDSSLSASAELNVGKDFGSLAGLVVTPNVGVRYEYLGFDRAAERGGDGALSVNREAYDSLQGRAGVNLGGAIGGLKPRLTATYVHDFLKQPGSFGANFVGGIGPDARFALATSDRNWGEVGGALRLGSDRLSVDVAADTTFARRDLNYQTYRATLNIHF